MHFTSFEQPKAILGLMSGTSLDGLDLAYCRFSKEEAVWNGEIVKTETVAYPENLKQGFEAVFAGTSTQLAKLHADRSHFVAHQIVSFLERNNLPAPLAISDHGQTIFHNPEQGYTTQIGSGAITSTKTGIPVICDFRQQDITLGGQGAPLVPIGDKHLFNNYQACLNLGGFANISHDFNNKRVGYDITVCNMALNELASRLNLDFDESGHLASRGTVSDSTFNALNQLPFLEQRGPKSLGREWYEGEFKPLLEKRQTEDLLATVCEHVAYQTSAIIQTHKITSLLLTGGGALNAYLVSRIQALAEGCTVSIPDKQLIEFKEAYIFGFLGALFLAGETNILASVTGALRDHRAGCIYLP